MSFHTEINPDNWLEQSQETREATQLGKSDEIYEDVSLEEEFGEEFDFLNYEIETKLNGNGDNILEGEGPDLEESKDGFLYNVEIRELVNGEGKPARKEVDEGLLAVHFTGYRDENGNDYIVHSDPKMWTEEGEIKYEETDEGLPDVEAGLQDIDNGFSIEENYSLDEGLSEIENYLTDIADRDERLGHRWGGLRDAVAGFHKSTEKGENVKISREDLNYGT